MCASGSVYNIKRLPASTPQPIERDQINACLGQNSDGMIVAFRGTLPPSLHSADSLHDWLVDCFVVPKVVSWKGAGRRPQRLL
jgi:hypothetical protein